MKVHRNNLQCIRKYLKNLDFHKNSLFLIVRMQDLNRNK
jgi:hypothetical protein